MAPDGAWLKDHIRDIADFPTPGVVFKDLTPLFADVDAFRFTVDAIADHVAGRAIDKVVAIEARGFIVAAPVAYRLGAGLVPVRKAGKLPWQTESVEYQLEYGVDRLEIHRDALATRDQVLVVEHGIHPRLRVVGGREREADLGEGSAQVEHEAVRVR